MNNAPRILRIDGLEVLAPLLIRDMRLDRLFSKETNEILRHTCKKDEILRRNRIFVALEDASVLTRVELLCSRLSALEKAAYLVNTEKTPLIKYFRYARLLEASISTCESLSETGDVFYEVGEFYSSDDMVCRLSEMRESLNMVNTALQDMRIGLISLSDKFWVTPDRESVSELERISELAEKLGIFIKSPKRFNIRPSLPFSDAVCRLFSDSVSAIEAEMAKFGVSELNDPSRYLSEVRFLLEIFRLVRRAEGFGIPHCFADISELPVYRASSLYDVSLVHTEREEIVPNDLFLSQYEPFGFVIGANGGGKTTFLRAVGINLILFLAGCPMFAKSATLYPFELALSHFPSDEHSVEFGRLDEERNRAEALLSASDGRIAFYLLNEAFSGANEERGFDMLKEFAKSIVETRSFGLCVTHFRGVKKLGYPIFSALVEGDENQRTYKIARLDGRTRSYAEDILKKYRLDAQSLTERRIQNGNKHIIP